MRSLCFFLIICIACCVHLQSSAQVIPSGRFYDWTGAGFRGILPDYSNTINIVQLGAANDGSSAVDSYIQAAVDSMNGRYGVIYFPAGSYLVNSTIALPDSVMLKGAGSDSTTITFDLNGAPNDCIDVSKNQDEALDPFVKIIAGFAKGSTTLTVIDASSFAANSYAEIRQDNGTWYTVPSSYAEKCIGQIVKVISVSGNSVQIEPALRIDLDTMLNPEIRIIRPATHVGIECMKIIRIDSSASPSVYNINFNFAVNCWVRGVESAKSMGAHVLIEYSKNIEVSGCYIHHSFGYDGFGTRGYGVCLRQHASDCLVENNFFRYLRHAMMVKEGANGNVFGYNYSIEPNRSESIPDFSGDISLHGHYAFANLFEGNIVQNIIIDQTWGQSGPHNTFLRNRAELYGMGVLPGSPPYTNDQNFVGNEITNTAVLHGNYYTQYGTGHFEHGNNVKGTVMPAGTSVLTDSTYYFNSKPAFWNNTAWPSIGIPNAINTGSNPAQQRYASAELPTICETIIIARCDTLACDDADLCTLDSCTNGQCEYTLINCDDANDCTIDTCSNGTCSNTPVNCDDGDICTTDNCESGVCLNDTIPGCHTSVFNGLSANEISLYPNPAMGFIIIELNRTRFPIEAAVMDYAGRTLFKELKELSECNSTGNSLRVTFPESMSNGLYLLRVIGGEKIFHHKFIKTE